MGNRSLAQGTILRSGGWPDALNTPRQREKAKAQRGLAIVPQEISSMHGKSFRTGKVRGRRGWQRVAGKSLEPICSVQFAYERSGLTSRDQPRRNDEVARVSGTDNTHRRWPQRFVRRYD